MTSEHTLVLHIGTRCMQYLRYRPSPLASQIFSDLLSISPTAIRTRHISSTSADDLRSHHPYPQ